MERIFQGLVLRRGRVNFIRDFYGTYSHCLQSNPVITDTTGTTKKMSGCPYLTGNFKENVRRRIKNYPNNEVPL